MNACGFRTHIYVYQGLAYVCIDFIGLYMYVCTYMYIVYLLTTAFVLTNNHIYRSYRAIWSTIMRLEYAMHSVFHHVAKRQIVFEWMVKRE